MNTPFAVLPAIDGTPARCVCVPQSQQMDVTAGALAAHRWILRSRGKSLHEAMVTGRATALCAGELDRARAYEAGFLGRIQQRLQRRRRRVLSGVEPTS